MSTENLYTPNRIRTYCGRYVNVMALDPNDVFPMDIAIGIARICRFGNHTKKVFSVAEHSIWCMFKAIELHPDDKPLHFRALMHDAHEAYLGDWCTPMIDAINAARPGFKEFIEGIKRNVQTAINTRFGIGKHPFDCEKIKAIDKMALEREWDNKVLRWTEMEYLGDAQTADMWLHYFKALVKTPVVIEA